MSGYAYKDHETKGTFYKNRYKPSDYTTRTRNKDKM